MKNKAEEMMNNPKVQDAVNKGKDLLNQGKDWIENGEGKEYLEKGKDMLGNAKDKLEDFVEDKTDGKGIFGFGEKKDAPAK